jgi:hypothetical protein
MRLGKRILGLLPFVVIVLMSDQVWGSSLTHMWSRAYGGKGQQVGNGVATDLSGNVLVTGTMESGVDFGGGILASAGGPDLFLAKFDPSGSHIWSQRFGDNDKQEGHSVATDAAGNVFVTGSLAGTVDFGGGPLASAGNFDVFLAKFDANGTHLWSQRFGDLEGQQGLSVATDAAGNVFVTGQLLGTADFGGGPLTSSGEEDIFLAKFDPNGAHLWSRRFGDADHQWGTGVATDAAGNSFVTGLLFGSVDFGNGVLTSAGGADIVIAKFDPNGTCLWSECFGDSSSQYGNAVATDPAGDLLLTGEFQGAVDFGGGALTSAGNNDVFLAKFDPNGTHLWSQRFGDGNNQLASSVATDVAGNVIFTGSLSGKTDFGGGPLGGTNDVFLAKFDPNGTHLWSGAFGDANVQTASCVATDNPGNVFLAGYFQGTVDFGGGRKGKGLVSVDANDVFLAKFMPDAPVPAALQGFQAAWAGDHVDVAWRLISITGDLTFDISRCEGAGGMFVPIDGAAVLTDPQGAFRFEDRSVVPGTRYTYHVVVREDGKAVTSFETSVSTPAARLTLGRNVPNPFNPETKIPFGVDTAGHVSLTIYDVSGKLVRTIVDGVMPAGTYTKSWDGRDARGRAVASGVYFIRLEAGDQTLTRQAVLLK